MFGKTLRNLRREHGLTQAQLAAMLHLDKSSIAKYESAGVMPSKNTLLLLSDLLGVSVDYLLGRQEVPGGRGIKIPVLGVVQAGLPMEATESVLDYEEITPEMARGGSFFALQIRGNSMEPRMCEGDVVIVRRQPDAENGQVAVVMVNGENATVKRLKKQKSGVWLLANNPAYEPMFYSNDEIRTLPVTVIGLVVELRGKSSF